MRTRKPKWKQLRDHHWWSLQGKLWELKRWYLTSIWERVKLFVEVGPREYFAEPGDMYFTLGGNTPSGRLAEIMRRSRDENA